MNVFNEAKNILKAIDSIYRVADEIHIYDGAYKNYPHEKPYSTDGTIDLIKKFPDVENKIKLFECTTPYGNQIEKRTLMFKTGKEGDYFFKLDGDEYITNAEEIRKYMDCEVGYAWALSNLYETPYMVTRLFKWRKGMHYAGRHHWLFDGKNNFIASDQNYSLNTKICYMNVRVFNFRDSSNVVRKKDKIEFLCARNPLEKEYLNELSVYHSMTSTLKAVENRANGTAERVETLKYCESPEFTFSLMFSRPWALDKYILCMNKLEIPKNTEAIVLIDSQDQVLYTWLKNFFTNSKKFAGAKLIRTGNNPLPEFANVAQRRARIKQNWHRILTEARGEILLGSEDDSLPQPDAYIKLLETLKQEKAHFVQGNIIGRWGVRLCPAWKVIDVNCKPVVLYSEKEKSEGLDEVQGTGWYCFVTYTDIFRKYDIPLDDNLPLGPDVKLGYLLSHSGYKLLHRWDIKVEHFTEKESLIVGETPTEQRYYLKDANSGQWNTLNIANMNSDWINLMIKQHVQKFI
jgi:hypothetical protein